jgi:hypothetical protein
MKAMNLRVVLWSSHSRLKSTLQTLDRCRVCEDMAAERESDSLNLI